MAIGKALTELVSECEGRGSSVGSVGDFAGEDDFVKLGLLQAWKDLRDGSFVVGRFGFGGEYGGGATSDGRGFVSVLSVARFVAEVSELSVGLPDALGKVGEFGVGCDFGVGDGLECNI